MGGPRHNGKRGRGTDKPKIVIALSKTENGTPLFARMKEVDDLKTKILQDFTETFLKNGVQVECDGYQSYLGLNGVNCTSKKYDTVNGDLKWLHRTIGNLKAFLNDTYYGRCTHLQTYLDEFCFRFNHRTKKDELFSRLARAVVTSCVLLS